MDFIDIMIIISLILKICSMTYLGLLIFGDGRRNTQFNLEKVSLDVIHAMEDWDLHCKHRIRCII